MPIDLESVWMKLFLTMNHVVCIDLCDPTIEFPSKNTFPILVKITEFHHLYVVWLKYQNIKNTLLPTFLKI